MPIALIAVVIIVVAAGGFYTLSNQSRTEQSVPEEQTITTTPIEQGLEAIDEANGIVETVNDSVVQSATDSLPIASSYADGTYVSQVSYFTPKRTEHEMDIKITLEDDVVTSAAILYDGASPESGHHKNFDDAYQTQVIGQEIDSVSLSRVGGASLTTNAFNDAIEDIINQAS